MARVELSRGTPPFSREDIVKLQEYFLSKESRRDYLLFEIGINTGLTNNELLDLKYSDFLTESLGRKEILCTSTNAHQFCPIVINDHLYFIVRSEYEKRSPQISIDSFIFVSEGRRKSGDGKRLTEQLVSGTIRKAVAAIGLSDDYKLSSLMKSKLGTRSFSYNCTPHTGGVFVNSPWYITPSFRSSATSTKICPYSNIMKSNTCPPSRAGTYRHLTAGYPIPRDLPAFNVSIFQQSSYVIFLCYYGST